MSYFPLSLAMHLSRPCATILSNGHEDPCGHRMERERVRGPTWGTLVCVLAHVFLVHKVYTYLL